MSDLQCYRCGASLESLGLPFGRLDECPSCTVYVHCCRMCLYYDPGVAEQCTEDDAEEVKDKTNTNFCDYFKPAAGRFDAAGHSAQQRAKSELDTLFGGAGSDDKEPDDDDPANAAEDLFR